MRKLRGNLQFRGKRSQSGVILALVAIGAVAVIAMAGLAIDVGHSYVNKSRLQNALDAAALSGALTLMTSRNTMLASNDATTTFNQHLVGEMAADAMTLQIQFSDTLVPFAPGGSDPDYIRVIVADYDRPNFLSRVLPGVADNKVIGTTAVAGKQPLSGGSQVCDIAPLLVCGDPTDTDPSDDTLFGVKYDDGNGSSGKYCLKASSSSGGNGNGGGGNGNGNGGGGNGNGNGGGGNCNQGYVEDDFGFCWPADCENMNIHDVSGNVGPGNFQLIQLDCGPGGNCVRENLAGGYGSCLTDDASVTTKPGNTVGPTAQGLNVRFGEYLGGMSRADYPPDFVTTEDITYNEYLGRYTDEAWDENDGAAHRRVMAVPIGNCGADEVGSGQTDVPVLGLGCFFMTNKTENRGQDNWIKGTLVRECGASGTPSEDPEDGTVGDGPYRIILYKDPDSLSS